MKITKKMKLLLATLAITAGLYTSPIKPNILNYATVAARCTASSAAAALLSILCYRLITSPEYPSVRGIWREIQKARTQLAQAQSPDQKEAARFLLSECYADLHLDVLFGGIISIATLCSYDIAIAELVNAFHLAMQK